MLRGNRDRGYHRDLKLFRRRAENQFMKSHSGDEFTQDFRRRTPEEVCFFGKYGHWPAEENESGMASARTDENGKFHAKTGRGSREDEDFFGQTFFPRRAARQVSFTKR